MLRFIKPLKPGYSWKPEIRIWTTLSHNSYQVHLWFSPLYPGAEYHKVQLHSDRHENSTDLPAVSIAMVTVVSPLTLQ